ncbi:hypothetical protein R6Q57_014696, partial [Mikania cordata]
MPLPIMLIKPLLLMGTTATSFSRGRRKQHQLQVPKGCLAVKVGEAGSEQQRFVVPVIWFNHPLFMQLLQVAEDEYGFEQIGTITIPCKVRHFRAVIGRILHQSYHYDHFGCFRVLAGPA